MQPDMNIEAMQVLADWAMYKTLCLIKKAYAEEDGLEALWAAPTVEHPLGPSA